MATKLTKKQQGELTEKLTGIIQKNNALQLRLSADKSVNEMNINQISGELNRIHGRAIGKELPTVINIPVKQGGRGDPSLDNIRPFAPYEIDGIGTVYGGELNIETGVLKVTHDIMEISDRTSVLSSWNKSGAALNGFYYNVTSMYERNRPMLSNMFKATTNVTEYFYNYGYCYHDESVAFNCDPSICGNTIASWYDYITTLRSSGTPIVITSELVAPVEIPLTPQQMLQLLDQL